MEFWVSQGIFRRNELISAIQKQQTFDYRFGPGELPAGFVLHFSFQDQFVSKR
jgi:hypothetical protein